MVIQYFILGSRKENLLYLKGRERGHNDNSEFVQNCILDSEIENLLYLKGKEIHHNDKSVFYT